MTDKPDRPHDTFFKETFRDEAKAAAELASILPPPVVELFDWSTLKLQPGAFENRKDRHRYSDLLFSVERADTRTPVFVFVLFEHQSADHPLMPLRMLRYMVRVWDRWLHETKTQRPPLPPVLPVVLTHDPRGWRSAVHFHDLFADDPGTRAIADRFLPAFEFALDDLARVSDAEIAARALPPATALSLWALRDGRDPDTLLQHVPAWAPVFAELDPLPDGADDADRIIGYLGDANGDDSVDVEVLVDTIAAYAPAARPLAMNSVQKLREEGRKEGFEKGRLEGVQDMLIKQLRRKFDKLTEEQIARIREADAATLDRYDERAVTADSIEAVLGSD